MLGAEFTTNDALILAALVVLFVLLALLGVAETGINRISQHKAEALAHEHPRRGRALQRLVEEPEKFLNPVLLTVNILQTATASLSTFLFTRLFGTWGAVARLRAQRRRAVRVHRGHPEDVGRPAQRAGGAGRRRGRRPGWCGSGRCA